MEEDRYRRQSKRSRHHRSFYDFLHGWDIQVNVPIRYYNDGRHNDSSLIEPFVHNIREFNADDGWVRDSDSTYNCIMQALSYYSYGYSDGKYLLCNLKGLVDFDRKVITICNPALMSRGRGGEFGPADIGERAIRRFFRSHDCCGICKAWPKPSGRYGWH